MDGWMNEWVDGEHDDDGEDHDGEDHDGDDDDGCVVEGDYSDLYRRVESRIHVVSRVCGTRNMCSLCNMGRVPKSIIIIIVIPDKKS